MATRLSPIGLASSLVAIAAGGLALVSLAAILAAGRWPFALLEHFHLHYLGLALVAAAGAAGLRRIGLVDLALLAATANLAVVVPDLSGSRTPARPGARPVRLLSINVLTRNRDHAAVARLIEATRPDVVVLLEVDPAWVDGLAPALAGFAGRLVETRPDNFGLAIHARRPFAAAAIELAEGVPYAVVQLDAAAGGLTVIAAHPVPPVTGGAARAQRAQLDRIADHVRALPGPRVLVGDLNLTPWSSGFARLRARSGLRDSRAGFGVQATFPSELGWAGIPIDHALVSAEVAVTGRRVGPAVGSDHRPIVVDLAVAP